jgi:hypothetical protein
MTLLTTSPAFPAKEFTIRQVLSTADPEKRSSRRVINQLQLREFEFSFELLNPCEVDNIVSIFKTVGEGGFFQIIPPDEIAQIDVQFVNGTLATQQASVNNVSLSFRVRECFC